MGGRVLTVASGKGGVGKTTTAVNLAVALWTEGNAVAVVDADLGMANLAAVLGLEPETTLHDVLAGRASVVEALVEAQDGDLLVLPGERSLAGFADADPNALASVLEELAERCDFVVVDTGAGLSYEDVLPLGLADDVLLVTTPDPAAIGDTRKTLELSGLLAGDVLGVVVTRAQDDTDAASVAAEIGVDLLAAIPDDPAVTKSTTEGKPLASHAPDAPATLAYAGLASVVIGDAAVSSTARADAGAIDEAVASAETGEAGDADAPDDGGAVPDEADAETDDDAVAPDEAEEAVGSDDVPAEPPDDADDATDAPDEEPTEEEEAVESDDAPAEPPDEADGAADGVDGRGGVTGWLGRLFS